MLFACPHDQRLPTFGKQYAQGNTRTAGLMTGTLASFVTIGLLPVWTPLSGG